MEVVSGRSNFNNPYYFELMEKYLSKLNIFYFIPFNLTHKKCSFSETKLNWGLKMSTFTRKDTRLGYHH